MVDHTRLTWRVSIRRACRALPVERSTYHYRSRRAGQAQLTERIKEIAATRVRYGYRRIHVLLRREGWRVNAKRVYRLYRELGLSRRCVRNIWRTSSSIRRLVKVRVKDMDAYRDFLGSTLRSLPGIRETHTYPVMKEVKSGNALLI
jgi:DNA-binding Lrp family transcriptional regulator